MTGVCECGCGGRTKRNTRSIPERGIRTGEYSRFLKGHFSRTARFKQIHSEIDTARTAHVGEDNPNWKGGRTRDGGGYVVVRIGRAETRREHRVVAEKMLGRALLRSEVVHHKNGLRDDNRPENLEVLASQSAHMKIHVTPDVARVRGQKGGWKRRAALAALKAIGEVSS